MSKKQKKHNKILSLARSILDCIKNVLSKAFIDNETSHGEFAVIRMKKKYCKLKENLRIRTSERGDIERDKLIKYGKKWALIKLLKKWKAYIVYLGL